MGKTSIQWADENWNPTTGCHKVSPGCRFCYAEIWTKIFPKGFPNGFAFTIHRARFDQPRHWRRPRMVFVNSMSDFFHEKMPLEVMQELFVVMGDCQRHTFQILTKRHQRLAELAPSLQWHPNIWIGVSVENQAYAELRIPYLLTVPAAVRFLSAEPLLGPLKLNLTGIHWVIVGGESQMGCRPMDIEWARSIRDQCREAGAAFFLKQLGGHPNPRHELSDFPPDLRIREWPKRAVQEELFA